MVGHRAALRAEAEGGSLADPAEEVCSVCRGTKRCTFCSGDGYVVENDKLSACGVCDTTGICTMCEPEV